MLNLFRHEASCQLKMNYCVIYLDVSEQAFHF